ncbi:glycosyltransferase family 2 protein [Alkalilimnicola sp. S0819]|uniref:glycosyltransferase family 2 protein n=1 Tax=Alkalilimnicola sp. S0819 TaxID=2613922 RepID=UPI0012627FB5|nr:glycosyltransferase family 2 protein [Alkalilimnicola sp. S0819]KAB7623793.1 glycosyltransferase family 2 protein [Alkalilimnicola sp. S0819]MPQ16667.1 glycosyltransferase [Alkalilimnicola sp. S0819]
MTEGRTLSPKPRLSIVLPAKNEAVGLGKLLPNLQAVLPVDAEIIVVNDGSGDETASIATEHGAKVITHPYSMGNGAAIKSGARAAEGEVIVFMDADGQHDPRDIERLLTKLEDDNFAMVVGARRPSTQASAGRRIANAFYNRLASVMTGFKIDDLTSGFRAVRARHFRKFLYLLPNGFSYPTTSTMAFFRSGLPVGYIPIDASAREGKSKIRLLHDGTRFLIIILKVGALFSPMRFFLPVSGALFSIGILYYGYTYLNEGRFTNMGALLFLSALSTFLIGLLSEQVSSLHYRGLDEDHRRTARDEAPE